MKKILSSALATWFGCGYFPWGPGTIGSLAALALAYALERAFALPPWAFLALAAVWFAPAVWAAGEAARRGASKDPGFVVIDEVIGQWITLAGAARFNWKSWLLALALFRLFDIWKPPPVRRLESLAGGLGIVADDVAAGVYGALVLFLAGCFNLY
jgi:phosphatidylglycerophosphatase A